MSKIKFQLLTLCLAFMPMLLWAQSGKITGTITDGETGETIIGATVSIQGTTKGAATDIDGNYLLLNVAPGTYTLEARYVGYSTVVVEEVIVRTDLTTNQDFELVPETIEGEEIVITAERQTVIKDLTSSEARVSKEEIEKLPVQEVSDVIQLQAGVNVDNNGGIHIRGGRSSEVSYVVDGIRVTDDYDRSQGVRIENESIQELQVISGTFNAEHGQALSGIVNVVTKSGSNEFEGSLRGWAGSYFVNDGQLYDGLTTDFTNVDPDRMYNLSGSVGGPIIKDKLTFFVTGRTFRNNGWKRGRNAYSPHGPYYDLLPLGTDLGTYRTNYGERVDTNLPWYSADTVTVQGRDMLRVIDNGERDSSLVNMDTFETYSGQSNLQWRPNSFLKFNLINTVGVEEGAGYNHGSKLVPGGIGQFQNFNYSGNLKTTITPSGRTFITLNAAMRYNESESFLYENPYDPRYFDSNSISDLNNGTQSPFVGGNSITFPGAAQFSEFGNDTGRFFRSTNSYIAKAEVSSQITDRHFIKAGLNFQVDELKFDSYSLQPIDSVAGVTYPAGTTSEEERFISLGIPGVDNPLRTKFSDSPYSISAYAQDKIEYENMIINLGLRFDYFEPNAQVPSDPRDPDINLPQLPANRYNDLNDNGEQDPNEPLVTLEERQRYWFRDASAKYQLSPRFGISYSINDNGVIYFSYGYFFQMPSYNYLYQNSRIRLEETDRLQGIYGNPDLKPERSIQFELGLKQEIFEGTAIEIVGYSKDTRDYVSTGITQRTYGTPIYQTWINRDYSNSKGLTFSFNQYVSQRVNIGLDYTFSIVEGSNSDPSAEFTNQNGSGAADDTTGSSLTKLIQPLDWDRSHIINGSFFYSGNNWNFNLLAKFLTGTPYTPATNIPGVTTGPNVSGRDLRNTERLPSRFTVDFNFSKDFPVGDNVINLFFNVYNVFDSQLVNSVFGDSGEPDRPLIVPENFDDTYYEDPNRYSEPRRIQLGVQFNF